MFSACRCGSPAGAARQFPASAGGCRPPAPGPARTRSPAGRPWPGRRGPCPASHGRCGSGQWCCGICAGLTGTGLRLGYEVASFQSGGDRLHLYGGGLRPTHVGRSPYYIGGYPEVFERSHFWIPSKGLQKRRPDRWGYEFKYLNRSLRQRKTAYGRRRDVREGRGPSPFSSCRWSPPPTGCTW